MKIYHIKKTGESKNLGAKIEFNQLMQLIKSGTIMLRNINGDLQEDFRIRFIPEERKRDRGSLKIIKSYFILGIEIGKKGFDNYFPREIFNEEKKRFRSIERLAVYLEGARNIKIEDWIINPSKTILNTLKQSQDSRALN
jgi:hypothetical protein